MIPLIISSNKTKISGIIQKLAKENGILEHNIFRILPLKEEITIGQIRELKKDLFISQNQKRMIVFFDFDKSGLETQNSLLKILEEKVDQNLFIFFVNNPEKIIPTIISRTKVVSLLNKKTEENDPTVVKIINEIKKVKNLSFIHKKEILITSKENFLDFSNKLLIYFEKELRKNDQNSLTVIRIIKKILAINHLVENNNLNPQLSFDNLLIFIWKNYSIKV